MNLLATALPMPMPLPERMIVLPIEVNQGRRLPISFIKLAEKFADRCPLPMAQYEYVGVDGEHEPLRLNC